MNLKDLKVLVIDDQPLMRELIQALLGQMLISKVTAVDGPDRAAILLRAGRPFDLVLVDWEMRPTSGIEFVKLLRAGDYGPSTKLPVIMVTGFADQERVVAAREAGISGFLIKPIDGRKLLALIQSILMPAAKPRPAAPQSHI